MYTHTPVETVHVERATNSLNLCTFVSIQNKQIYNASPIYEYWIDRYHGESQKEYKYNILVETVDNIDVVSYNRCLCAQYTSVQH
jgi:hypothetical protein